MDLCQGVLGGEKTRRDDSSECAWAGGVLAQEGRCLSAHFPSRQLPRSNPHGSSEGAVSYFYSKNYSGD